MYEIWRPMETITGARPSRHHVRACLDQAAPCATAPGDGPPAIQAMDNAEVRELATPNRGRDGGKPGWDAMTGEAWKQFDYFAKLEALYQR
jgi:hypothetical protein